MRRAFLAAALAAPLAFLSAAAAPASAEDKPTLVVNITSDDVWTEQMALGFARNIQKDGYPVVVFLNVRAVTIANRKVPQHKGAMTGKTAAELIEELLDDGARVFVCPTCTKQAGLDIDERLQGIEPGGPEFRKLLMAPSTKIISY